MTSSRRVLIAEDEKAIQQLCRRILGKGYVLICAGGVGEASSAMRKADRLDLLITDLRLPDGDGVDVIKECKEVHPAARVLVITGSPTPDSHMGALLYLGLSEEDILSKPFDVTDFERAVQKRVDGSRS